MKTNPVVERTGKELREIVYEKQGERPDPWEILTATNKLMWINDALRLLAIVGQYWHPYPIKPDTKTLKCREGLMGIDLFEALQQAQEVKDV